MALLLIALNLFNLTGDIAFAETSVSEIQRNSVRVLVSQGGATAIGLSFGKNLLLINRHAWDEWGDCNESRVEIYTPNEMKPVGRCEKKIYCSSSLDFCVIQTTNFQDSPPVDIRTYSADIEKKIINQQRHKIFKIGKTIESEDGWLQRWGLLFYCIPTNKGDSGSALFSGNYWLGMHTERVAVNLGCADPKTSSGIPAESILEDIRKNAPQLL